MFNLKKILLVLVCFIAFFSTKAFAATDVNDAKAFFDNFVKDLNSYNANVPNYFTSDAKIYRVVIKKDGSKESVSLPFDKYVSELHRGKLGAKLAGYKNRFENIAVTKKDDTTYKLTAKRFPMNDTTGLAAEYIIVDTGNGLKIKSESWDTTVQKFLNKK